MKYSEIEEAIDMQNGVKQGLSSAIMTTNLREAEKFLSLGKPIVEYKRKYWYKLGQK